MKIGEKIRKIREMKGLSQEYLARQLNITPQAFGKIEREETSLDFKRLEDIAKLLGVNPLDIVNFDETHIFNNTFNNHASVYNQATYPSTPMFEKTLHLLLEEVSTLRKTNELLLKFLEKKS
jgi:transcriptional regulator with XRE-family HTH domain